MPYGREHGVSPLLGHGGRIPNPARVGAWVMQASRVGVYRPGTGAAHRLAEGAWRNAPGVPSHPRQSFLAPRPPPFAVHPASAIPQLGVRTPSPQMFRGPRNRVNSTTPLARPDLVREMGRCGGPVTEGTRGRCDTLYIGAVCNAGVASISWTPERLQSKRRDGRKTFPLRAGVPASDGEVGAGGPHARGVGRWMRIQVEAAGIEPASASTPPLALHV